MSYLVLARKWRPQRFEDVVGQQSVVRTLQNAIDRDRIPHAIIFSGVRGVGKTTLLSLILRFYQPTDGEIYYDNRPASDYEVGSLRKRFGYVAQRPRLLSDTIANNLRYGNPDARWTEMVRAATAAGIHDFIEKLPNGYQTKIGEKGVNLSEGQKQRLAIARALIKDPDIMILDEPFAGVHPKLMEIIFQYIYRVNGDGKAIVIISHDMDTIFTLSKRLLVLDNGDLIADGDPEIVKKDPAVIEAYLGHDEDEDEQ